MTFLFKAHSYKSTPVEIRTFVERVDAHRAIPRLRVTQRVTVGLVQVVKIQQFQQLQHRLPRLSAEEVSHYLAVSPAYRLVRRELVGGVAGGESVTAEQREDGCNAVLRCLELLESEEDLIDRLCGHYLVGARQVREDDGERREQISTDASGVILLTSVVTIDTTE